MTEFIQQITGHPVVITAIILLVVEQIFLSRPGSFPYRYGIPVKAKRLGLPAPELRKRLAESPGDWRYQIQESEEVLYLSGTYPAGTWGPLLFVGEIRLCGNGAIIIRMAHVTSLFFFFPIAGGLLRFDLYGMIPAVLAILFGAWLYRRFVRALDVLVKR
jgi:hypothetical protein